MVANVPLLSKELVNIFMGNYPGSFNPMHGFYFLHFMRYIDKFLSASCIILN